MAFYVDVFHFMPSHSPSSQILVNLLNLLSRMPLGILQAFAAFVASLLSWFPEQGILRTIRRNLQITFPDWSAEQLKHHSELALHHQLLSSIEFVKCWGDSPESSIKRIKKIHGEAILDAALAHPQGCMAIVPHYGNWEMMNAWVNQRAAAVIMYKPDRHPALNTFVFTARTRLKATLVPTDEKGVRQIFRILKQGGFTIILPDHIPEVSGGVMSPFLGLPVLTSTLAAKLVQKTQCAVIQLSCIRQAHDPQYFEITVESANPLMLSCDLQQSVDAMNQTMEQLIRRAPEHYHWSYKRFKATPHLGAYYHCDDATATVLRQQAYHAAQQAAQES
jgi:Kdo2-lipid IVA lauroyltransferase/acyltransferase